MNYFFLCRLSPSELSQSQHSSQPRETSSSSKEALTEAEISKRLQFGKHMESLRHGAEWYFRHVVWTDVCNDVLPITERKCLLQAQARKGGAGWMSAGSETQSYNLRGKKEQLKLRVPAGMLDADLGAWQAPPGNVGLKFPWRPPKRHEHVRP